VSFFASTACVPAGAPRAGRAGGGGGDTPRHNCAALVALPEGGGIDGCALGGTGDSPAWGPTVFPPPTPSSRTAVQLGVCRASVVGQPRLNRGTCRLGQSPARLPRTRRRRPRQADCGRGGRGSPSPPPTGQPRARRCRDGRAVCDVWRGGWCMLGGCLSSSSALPPACNTECAHTQSSFRLPDTAAVPPCRDAAALSSRGPVRGPRGVGAAACGRVDDG